MKTFKANTIPELKRLKGIKFSEIEKVIAKQTYYNWTEGKTTPTNSKPIDNFCKLFEISRATFDKLLKNTIK